jgi:hypothetical protein
LDQVARVAEERSRLFLTLIFADDYQHAKRSFDVLALIFGLDSPRLRNVAKPPFLLKAPALLSATGASGI